MVNTPLTKSDIPECAPASITLPDGSRVTVRVEPDESMSAPWEEHDGHGIVSQWTSRAKLPGEMVLASDRANRRYYDFAGSLLIARRDGWGSPEGGRTPRERAALATLTDFRRLRAWCNDEWSWIGVIVEVERPDGSRESDSLWGIESDGDYWRDVAAELINGLTPEVRSMKTGPRVPVASVRAAMERLDHAQRCIRHGNPKNIHPRLQGHSSDFIQGALWALEWSLSADVDAGPAGKLSLEPGS